MAKRRTIQKAVKLSGIGVSPGVAVGPAFVMATRKLHVVEKKITARETEHEVCRLEDAIIDTRRQIKKIQGDLEKRTASAYASVFDAHLMVLDDRAFIEEIVGTIRKKHKNAEWVVYQSASRYAAVLASVKDDYLRERVADIKDVARRIIRNLSGDTDAPLSTLTSKHIIIAPDLAPSETAALRKDMVEGFATDMGSPTSHTALMARALEIPAVVGLHDISDKIVTGEEVLIDGNKGVVILHPTREQLKEYGKLAKARKDIERGLTSLKNQPAETKDGHRVVLAANAESLEEISAIKEYGVEGIGLFRSEYLYLMRNGSVSEDEQEQVYRQLALSIMPDPVIIRTLDLGGDKFFGENDDGMGKEENPFLGCRSIRYSLLHPDEFKIQLRAILKASAVGNIKLMYPMISSVDEVIRANELLEEAKKELSAKGVPFRKELEVGIMVEIPSAALTADTIAPHVSFFSLGTNDLIQYTLAVDRVNERVAHLYEPTHPAVLNLIRKTVEAGHRNKIWVGLCGEMAADPVMAPLLLGLGVDELSMAPSAVPMVKDTIRSIELSEAEDLMRTALACKTGSEVLTHCRKLIKKTAPELMKLIKS